MERQINNICWHEVVWHRPFEIDTVHELLIHLASFIPRGSVVWEVRGCDGNIRYLLGADRKFTQKIKELFRAHGKIQFHSVPEHTRKVIGTAKQLKISHPTLSLKMGV
jgi:hypothetical protein